MSYTDSLIGSTVIDMENRHYSNLLWLDRRALILEEKKQKADVLAANSIKGREGALLKKKLRERK